MKLVGIDTLSNTARTALGLAAFARRGQTPAFAYQSMIQLFCATGGLSNDLMSSLLSLTRRPYALPDSNGVLGDMSRQDIDAAVRDIEVRGFHVFKRRLPEEVCDQLTAFATTAPCVRQKMDEEESGDVLVQRYPRENADAVRYEFREADLIDNIAVQKLMADRSFVAIAQNYLRAQPIVDVVTMWWSAASAQPDKHAAQYWHFDMDRIKWLKFFVYLTDVGPDNGPHSFVAGSHRRGGISRSLLEKGYSRLTDEEVVDSYPRDKFVEFTAPRGTVIAEDTRGLHKGKRVTQGDRLIFQMQFSNSLFGGQYPKSRFSGIDSSDLRAMARSFPRLYSNYT